VVVVGVGSRGVEVGLYSIASDRYLE
jgi:hypothetical protein